MTQPPLLGPACPEPSQDHQDSQHEGEPLSRTENAFAGALAFIFLLASVLFGAGVIALGLSALREVIAWF